MTVVGVGVVADVDGPVSSWCEMICRLRLTVTARCVVVGGR